MLFVYRLGFNTERTHKRSERRRRRRRRRRRNHHHHHGRARDDTKDEDIVVVGTSRTTQSTITSSRTGTSIGREMGSRHRRVVATRRVWCDWRDDDGAADVSRDDRARSGVRVWRRGRRRIRVRRRE